VHIGKLKYVSVEQRAESGEQRLESGKFRIFCVILGEAVPISVELEIFSITFFGKEPHSRGHYNLELFEEPMDPIGVEDCICY
jgi:hypothetical protein